MRKLVIAAALLAAGCSSVNEVLENKVDYKTANQLPPLEIPPDLSAPTRDSRYVLPESARVSATLSGYEQERRDQGRPGTTELLPDVKNVRLERDGDARWLVVDQPPEKVWPIVRDFWQERGFLISREVPEAGVLETDWAENRANIPQGILRDALGRFADQVYATAERDKFRTRIDRSPDGKGTEIYVSHRGMREVYTNDETYGEERRTVWQPRDPDPGLEAEFLRLLMVRLGVDEAQAKRVASASPQQEQRASLVKTNDGTVSLQVDEPFDRAWRRVGLALDRVGFTVEDRDRQNGLYYVRYADPEGEMRRKDAERGFFAKLFSWDSKDKVKPEQYRVQVRQQSATSQVNVLNKNGEAETSATAQRILGLLHEQLK